MAGSDRVLARTPSFWAQYVPAVVALLVNGGALRNGFAYDDVVLIERNARLHDLHRLGELLRWPYWYDSGHLWRPLTSLTWAIEWWMGGGTPAVFHLVNLLLHALVASLVARLALRWLTPVGALASGLIFAIHPVHVEAVANVVGAAELLCAALLLSVALIAMRAPESAPRRGVIALLSGAALASKETGVVAPVIAWAGALMAPSPNTNGQPDRGRSMRFAIASLAGILPVIVLRVLVLDTLAGDLPHPAFAVARGAAGTMLALSNLPRAALLAIVPQLPRPDYSPTNIGAQSPTVWLVAAGVLLVAAGIVALVMHARRPTPMTFAIVLSAAALAPVSNLLVRTGVVIAERTLYLPSVGGALLLGSGFQLAWQRRKRVLLGLAGCVAGGALVLSLKSVGMWTNTSSVVRAMVQRQPDSYAGWFKRGQERFRAGDYVGAQGDFDQAVTLFDGDAAMLFESAQNALRISDRAKARTLLERAIAVSPSDRRSRTLLVRLTLEQHDIGRARRLLEDGLRLEPDQRTWRALIDSLGSP